MLALPDSQQKACLNAKQSDGSSTLSFDKAKLKFQSFNLSLKPLNVKLVGDKVPAGKNVYSVSTFLAH